jgi:hypothetical protein
LQWRQATFIRQSAWHADQLHESPDCLVCEIVQFAPRKTIFGTL